MWESVVAVLLGDPPREPDAAETAEYYTTSYLMIRTCVGVLGIALPVMFIVGEEFFLGGRFRVRGSISAYYHTSMRDVFVAGLSVIAFLLITYMGGHLRTRDFWYSATGGLALLGVVFFPDWRSGIAPGAPLCGAVPSPPDCSPVEQALGEARTAHVHVACAVVYILSLALMSFLFARDEIVTKDNRKMQIFHLCCGVLILVGGLWAFVGVTVGPFARVYLGEVVAVWSFATSWLFKGYSVRRIIGDR